MEYCRSGGQTPTKTYIWNFRLQTSKTDEK